MNESTAKLPGYGFQDVILELMLVNENLEKVGKTFQDIKDILVSPKAESDLNNAEIVHEMNNRSKEQLEELNKIRGEVYQTNLIMRELLDFFVSNKLQDLEDRREMNSILRSLVGSGKAPGGKAKSGGGSLLEFFGLSRGTKLGIGGALAASGTALLGWIKGTFDQVITVLRGLGLSKVIDTFSGAWERFVGRLKTLTQIFTFKLPAPVLKALDMLKSTKVFATLDRYLTGLMAAAKFGLRVGKFFSKANPILLVGLSAWDAITGYIEGFSKTKGGVFDKLKAGVERGMFKLQYELYGFILDGIKNAFSAFAGMLGFDPVKKFLDSYSFESGRAQFGLIPGMPMLLPGKVDKGEQKEPPTGDAEKPQVPVPAAPTPVAAQQMMLRPAAATPTAVTATPVPAAATPTAVTATPVPAAATPTAVTIATTRVGEAIVIPPAGKRRSSRTTGGVITAGTSAEMAAEIESTRTGYLGETIREQSEQVSAPKFELDRELIKPVAPPINILDISGGTKGSIIESVPQGGSALRVSPVSNTSENISGSLMTEYKKDTLNNQAAASIGSMVGQISAGGRNTTVINNSRNQTSISQNMAVERTAILLNPMFSYA